MDGAHGAFARFLLLTLCRREEAARMTWGELSADRKTWTLPASRSKNHKAHIVKLPPAAQRVLTSLSKIKGNSLVFALNEKKGLSAFTSITKRLGQTSSKDRWRLHDFRRTGVTRLAEMGFPPHVCDRLLNHAGGTISGVAKIYQQHDFQAERKAALEGWAAYVIACAEKKDVSSERGFYQGSFLMKPWNIWQALAWLQWGSDKWCERYGGSEGGFLYSAGLMFPNMCDPAQPAHIRDPEKAAEMLLEAFRFKSLKTYPEQSKAFWLSRQQLGARSLPDDMRLIDAEVQAMFPVPKPSAAEWMATTARAEIEAGKRLKFEDARSRCTQATGCTTRQAEAAWKELPDDLKGSRGRPRVSSP